MMINNLEALKLFAHHKGGGSTANGRNSAGRRLGAKRADGQKINAGSFSVNAVLRSTRVRTLVSVATTLCLL